MAMVEAIRVRDGLENPDTYTEVGKCSSCHGTLIYQPNYGFPTRCPHCEEELENGTDDREFIKIFYRKDDQAD